MRALFFGSTGELRSGWWCLLFYLALAAFVLPLILAGRALHLEVTVGVQSLAVVAATLVCQRLRRKPLTEITGQFDLRWVREFALGGLGGSVLMVAPAALLLVGGWVRFSLNSVAFSDVASAALACIAVAVTEELLFRGFVFQRLIAGLGVWPAQVLIGAYFVLTHSSNPHMTGVVGVLAGLNIFVASVLFGAAFVKTRSLAMPIGLHAGANWVQGALLGFGVSGHEQLGVWSPHVQEAPTWLTGGAFGLEASVPGLGCLLVLTALMLRWRSTSPQRS